MDERDIRIDDVIIKKTTKCKHDFSCLSGDKRRLCDVVASNGDDIVEIKAQPFRSCSYCMCLDSASYCHCPTRNEIYNRYRI
jgi:hypothetical protein